MSKLTHLFFSFIFIYSVLAQTDTDFVDKLCEIGFNYTSNGTFRTNLDRALAILPTTNSGYGFFNSSSGRNPDTANAIALCRSDTERNACGDCLNRSIVRLRQECPNQRDSAVYYDNCMVKYSNESVLGKTQIKNVITHASPNNATDGARFHQDVVKLFENLTAEAADGGLLKYATGTVTGPNATVTYGLVQCTNCLEDAVGRLANCCYGKTGARVLLPLCNLRYEDYRFYNDVAVLPPRPPPPPPSPSPSVTGGKPKNLTRIVSSIVITTAACAIIAVTICNLAIFRKKKLLQASLESKITEISILEFLEYSLDTVLAATNDFSEDNKIGEGGFGSVYKGELEDGRLIAVKRLSRDSGQGEQQFKNEVLLVAKLHHRNLVGLLGFCLEEKERLLIYDYLPNSSLDKFYIFNVFLTCKFADPTKSALLDWEKRYNIIEGVARGLLYLHEDSRLRILHRDLKASNVFGYMAPEYVMHGHFSIKLDVFSFGVLVLEIITGQSNQDFQQEDGVYLLSYAWKSWRDGTLANIIDPVLLKGPNSLNDIFRSVHIALLCVQKNAIDRPTMSQVVLMLGSSSLTLQVPLEPAFFYHSTIDASKEGSNRSESPLVSVNDVTNSEMVPR
ncbi:putative protein kinase RLK-Pelle-DLSV family [Helianthus debilis subsp. tardiflorus]